MTDSGTTAAQVPKVVPTMLRVTGSRATSRMMKGMARKMFTVTDSIENRTDAAIALSPYGRATRFFKPTDPSVYVLHEGFIGVLGDLGLHEVKYSETEDDTTVSPGKATGGWLDKPANEKAVGAHHA